MMTSAIERSLESYSGMLPHKAAELFVRYWTLLQEWRQAVNLTGCRTEEEFAQLFIGDVLALLHCDPAPEEGHVIDIGSGAGNPGIPLAVAWPDRRFTLVDSRQRRCAFLRRAVTVLGLTQVEIVEGRAEDFAHQDRYREQYALATARAVGPAPWAIELCAGFVRTEGEVCLFVSEEEATRISQELEAVSSLGLKAPIKVRDKNSAGKAIARIRKATATPQQFPRSPKQAQKLPLY